MTIQETEQIIVLSPFIKLVVLPIAGALLTLVVYYIKEMRSDIGKLNDNILNFYKYFAPREETDRRICELEHWQIESKSRLGIMEEWRNGVEHRYGGVNFRPVPFSRDDTNNN